MLECDMFLPIKEYLENLGYSVKAEVNNLDIMAIKDDAVIVVEMKKQLTLKHLYQGCDRQRMFDNVYLAIFDPGLKTVRSKAFKEKKHILHRLGLGLMLVNMDTYNVTVIQDPKEYHYRRNKKKQKQLLSEYNNRKTSDNIGGSSKKKIMTVYREQVIEIAKNLVDGPLTTKEIRELTNNEKTTNILYKNYYGWFERTDKGIYQLSDRGRVELIEYLLK